MEELQAEAALPVQAGDHSESHTGDSLRVLRAVHQARADPQDLGGEDLRVHLAAPCASEDSILLLVGLGSHILDSLLAGEDNCREEGHNLSTS